MTVYIDNMKLRAKLWRWNGTWSNLWADGHGSNMHIEGDDLAATRELLDFAEKLELSRLSMVDEGYTTERFIISETKRREAIKLGADGIQHGGLRMMRIIDQKQALKYREKPL